MDRPIRWLLMLLALCTMAGAAAADDLTFSGTITQSTADGTGVYDYSTNSYQAVNNSSLNNISDGDTYTVTLDFSGSIPSPGTYDLTGAAFTDTQPGVSASETGFDLANPLTSLTVVSDGANDDLFLSVCLTATAGSACDQGDELQVYFAIPASDLNSPVTSASVIPGLYPPLNLLEDDGQTDIQASVDSYSYSGTVTTAPEPGSLLLMCCGLLALALVQIMRRGSTSVICGCVDRS